MNSLKNNTRSKREGTFLTGKGGAVLILGIGLTVSFTVGGAPLVAFAMAATAMSLINRIGTDYVPGLLAASQPVPDDHPATRIVEKLARQAGFEKAPQLVFADEELVPKPLKGLANAAALGTPKSAAIMITPDIEKKLSPSELEAVLAHEMSHIIHSDTKNYGLKRALGMTVVLPVLYTCTLIGLAFLTGTPLTIPAAVPLILGAGLTANALAQAAISRAIERRADRESVRQTGNPWAMASALEQISGLTLNRFKKLNVQKPGPVEKVIISLFRSHPKTTERREALQQTGEEMITHNPALRQVKEDTLAEIAAFRQANPANDDDAPVAKKPWDERYGPWGRPLIALPAPSPLSSRMPFNQAAKEQDNNPLPANENEPRAAKTAAPRPPQAGLG